MLVLDREDKADDYVTLSGMQRKRIERFRTMKHSGFVGIDHLVDWQEW